MPCPWQMDHVCYRCARADEYAAVCAALEAQGHALLTESVVGGRPIATFELSTPLRAAGFTVRCLEVFARHFEDLSPHPSSPASFSYSARSSAGRRCAPNDDLSAAWVLRLRALSLFFFQVPSPKPGSPYPSGLEHAELVLRHPPVAFADATEQRWAVERAAAAGAGETAGAPPPPPLAFDRRAALKAANPDVSVRGLSAADQ